MAEVREDCGAYLRRRRLLTITAFLLYLTTILPAGLLTFYLMARMKIGYVFKGQENRATSEYGCNRGGKMALDGLACGDEDRGREKEAGKSGLGGAVTEGT